MTQVVDKFSPKGVFHLEHWRGGKLLSRHRVFNAVTTTGKNNIFDSFFRNIAPPTNWYIGLLDAAGDRKSVV